MFDDWWTPPPIYKDHTHTVLVCKHVMNLHFDKLITIFFFVFVLMSDKLITITPCSFITKTFKLKTIKSNNNLITIM